MATEATILAELLKGLVPAKETEPKSALPPAVVIMPDAKATRTPPSPIPTALSAVPSDSEPLDEILATKETIKRVKENLANIIDGIADNPSLISRASEVWGAWPTWQKVAVGLVLAVPAASVGAATGFSALLALSGVATATGIALEDHHACTVNIKQKLKEGILSITVILEAVITDLDSIRIKLAKEVSKFKEENRKLALNVCRLQDQIETLTLEVETLVDVKIKLIELKENMEKRISELAAGTKAQAQELKETQETLSRLNAHYEQQQKLLADKINELGDVRRAMTQEVERTKKVSSALEVAVSTLAGQVGEDKTKKDALHTRLTAIVGKEEETVNKLLGRMNATTGDLETAKIDLEMNNSHNSELLKRQEALISRLEHLDSALARSFHTHKSGVVSKAPSFFSYFGAGHSDKAGSIGVTGVRLPVA